MKNENTPYLEIAESGNFIRIEVKEFMYPNEAPDRDENSLDTLITVKAGSFSGKVHADLLTTYFERFKQELVRLYDSLDGTASFCSLEENVDIKLSGDGMGHIKVECKLVEYAGAGYQLNVEFDVDQTHIPGLIRQLDIIINEFPLSGRR